MRYPKLRELGEAVKALIKGPYTSRFPYEPHKPPERFRGKPYFHEEDCIGCAACTQVCPTGACEFTDDVKEGYAKRRLTLHWDVCIFCGQCQANCPTAKGIILSNEFDLAFFQDRQVQKQAIEKDFIYCACCGRHILPADQYNWVIAKLGPLFFSNSSLILFYLRKLSLALKEKFTPKKEKTEFLRSDRIDIICPRCRREAVLKS
jgi:hydrogenase-4 component H